MRQPEISDLLLLHIATRRRPDSEVSAPHARHSRVKSSTRAKMRKIPEMIRFARVSGILALAPQRLSFPLAPPVLLASSALKIRVWPMVEK